MRPDPRGRRTRRTTGLAFRYPSRWRLQAKRKRRSVTLTHLVEVFRRVGELSLVSRTERSTSYDFERSWNYLCEKGLQDHVDFVSFPGRDETLPLNSERHIYEMNNIVLRDLEIELDDRRAWDSTGDEDWVPVGYAKWHFERCRFRCPSPNGWAFAFPWRGSFRFHKCEFRTPSARFGGTWMFAFRTGSMAWFVGNDFAGSRVQTRCDTRAKGASDDASSDDAWTGLGRVTFVGNLGIDALNILDGYATIEITGMNRIGGLSAALLADPADENRTSIYLGPRERIDPSFHHCLRHRSLFLAMRQIAATNHDSRQLTVLDRQLERIEYFLNKGQEAPSPLDWRVWIEYWQDRILYAWRRWSSDFYRSWLRPIVMLVAGYLLINAAPALVVEPFSVAHWVDLTLRPVGEIATYEASLGRIVGTEYGSVPRAAKTFLRLAGLFEVVWIGVWGFALAKALRR